MTRPPSSTSVHLGFAVPSGTPVEIPLKHMAVCGQTQEAGKTTALEALITRAGVRALTFITKRGEASFTSARRSEPYFREQADWQFVAAILEASRGEKLKFERAWIIRASKGARTLADVQRNVQLAMKTAKGLAGDVYLTLDAYLEVVVPAIARVRWAAKVELAAGVNAMDLTALSLEMQHLVIQSSIEWVLEHGTETVVVVPEAWKFIPQGRGTPVKRSAAAFIRQGAALRNYLWLDSQDLGGIEKEILRSVPVWILGVQREANEIKRTLENIPEGIAKPSKADIATLELGQFFACWGKHAIRTYAQPAWLDAESARQVARGELPVDILRRTLERPMTSVAAMTRAFAQTLEEETVTKDEAERLTAENRRLTDELARLKVEHASLQLRLEALEKGPHDSKREATPRQSADRHPAQARTSVSSAPAGGSSNGHVDEALYQAIRARILEDEPILLKALTTHPELVVEVTPKVVTVEGSSMKGRVVRLMAAGWFDEPRETGDVRKELARTGTDPGGGGTLGIMLNRFVVDGFFIRQGGAFVLAPAVKVSERELRVT